MEEFSQKENLDWGIRDNQTILSMQSCHPYGTYT